MMNISTYGMLDVIFNNIDHILFVANEDAENFNLLYINDTTGILGIEKEVFYKMPVLLLKYIHPDDKKLFVDHFISSVNKNKMIEFEVRIIKPNNKLHWLLGKFIPVKGPVGKVNRVVGVASDVTSRKNEELRLGNLYKVQGDVMKILAHDLRTPISGIKILAESIIGNTQLNENHLNRIISNCNESLHLMEDLLSYIQADSENMKINLTQIVVEDSINFVIESFSFLLAEKNIFVDLPNSQTHFYLDSLRFNQILSNIFSNAIKFSYKDGRISISVISNEKNLTIYISDEGIGIPEEMIPPIFDVFTSSKRSGTFGEKSIGLGMYITKRLVEFHNGDIFIFSNKAKGSTVKLVFPVNIKCYD